MNRALDILSIKAYEDPNLLVGYEDPNLSVASWRPAGTATAVAIDLDCVAITIGRSRSTVHGSGCAAALAGLPRPPRRRRRLLGGDGFAVRRHTAMPAGYEDPNLRCGARDLVAGSAIAGGLTAIGVAGAGT